MNELPKECVLPVGVDWCGINEDGRGWFTGLDSVDVTWLQMCISERKYVAARCAMWWKRKYEGIQFRCGKAIKEYAAYQSWECLCYDLEDGK
jgi:hypothetical protein